MDDAPEKFPPEAWFAAVAEGRAQRVAFRDVNGDTEFVRAEWIEENIFELKESPLLVDGVSIWDYVEVEWREGGVDPHFARLTEGGWGCRTIRSRATPAEVKEFLRVCEHAHVRCFEPHRYERGVFVTAVHPDAIQDYREFDEDVTCILPGEWVFTDTGTQK